MIPSTSPLLMSEVEPQVPIDSTPQEDNVLQSVDTSSATQEVEAPHGKHEVKSPQPGNPAEEAGTIEQDGHGHANGTEKTSSEDPLALEDLGSPSKDQPKPEAEEIASSAETGKGKPAMSVKITESKSASPPTPQVKKVCIVSQHNHISLP